MHKLPLTALVLVFAAAPAAAQIDNSNSVPRTHTGTASWYGEAHRGKPMANGKAFNPDKLTAASWFYPLGTTLEIQSGGNKKRCVRVVITDRGPSRQLVKEGRIIDLSREAFRSIARLEDGLTGVTVQEVLVPTNRH